MVYSGHSCAEHCPPYPTDVCAKRHTEQELGYHSEIFTAGEQGQTRSKSCGWANHDIEFLVAVNPFYVILYRNQYSVYECYNNEE